MLKHIVRSLPLFYLFIVMIMDTASAEVPDIDTLQQYRERAENETQSNPPDKSVTEEFQKFGEALVKRVDRILKRKGFVMLGDPWTIQGLPLAFPSRRAGFHLGLISVLANVRREDPHQMELRVQLLSSDLGRYKHYVQIDFPHSFDGTFRIRSKFSYNREINYPYLGVGNEVSLNRTLLENNDVLYKNITKGPTLSVQVFRRFGKYFRFGPILGLSWVEVTAPVGSLLELEQPLGIAGGRSHSVGFGLVYETIDFEPYPSEGSWHELYFNYYTSLLASSYHFVRGTYTFRKYIPLHRQLTLAQRSQLEVLSGAVPYFELNQIGGSDPSADIGEDTQIRGWDSNRFIDRIRMILGFELRWDPIQFTIGNQDFTVGFVPFFDLGRVWPSVFPLQFGPWHASTGWGARVIWNKRFVVRSDFAINSERTMIYFNIGHSF